MIYVQYRDIYNVLGIKTNGFKIEFVFHNNQIKTIMYGKTKRGLPDEAWKIKSIGESGIKNLKHNDLVEYIFMVGMSEVFEMETIR